jgi:hypothetical protein
VHNGGLSVISTDPEEPGLLTVVDPTKDTKRQRHFEFNDVLDVASTQTEVFQVGRCQPL